ncbi:MAG: Tat pathway signal protein, partial [Bacteroidetes bacterium]|nr:Tat pathway signal protein [Bacteroidota bacterium]
MTVRPTAVSLILSLLLMPAVMPAQPHWDPFLDTLQQRTLQWFLDVTPEKNGLTPDRWPTDWSPASIAAVGFALTTYPVAAERGLITREQAAERTLSTLRYFWALPQSADRTKTAGYRGLFYHFLKKDSGLREWNCELSTIDTGLLMAGVLFSQSYFDKDSRTEREIRVLADSLYRRVDWKWMTNGKQGITM